MNAAGTSSEPRSGDPLPHSTRIYVTGEKHPGIRVPFREIKLTPTRAADGTAEPTPRRVYDCSGRGATSLHWQRQHGLPCGNGSRRAVESSRRPRPINPFPGAETRRSPPLCAASRCAPNPVAPSPSAITPARESLRRRWNTWPSAKTWDAR